MRFIALGPAPSSCLPILSQSVTRATAAVVQAAKGQAIEALLQQLEDQSPTLDVTEAIDQLSGGWQLLYTSLTIKVRR